MECIRINCSLFPEHIISEENDAIPIEYDDDVIKNTINSNFRTFIKVCKCVNKKKFRRSLVNHNISIFRSNKNNYIITNYNYLKDFGLFTVCIERQTSQLEFCSSSHIPISTNEFMNKIKKGTIIEIWRDAEEIITKLENLLCDHNSDLILKKINKCGNTMHMIDCGKILTKPAIKQKS